METLEATVVKDEEKYFIKIVDGNNEINIPLSEDQPNKVKLAFNSLILRLKKGKFEIIMTEVQGDLFSQVANEYIKQLNKEILEVFGEMKQYGLVEE